MKLDIKSAYVGILLAVVVCGVFSYPQPDNNNAENSKVHATINKPNKTQKLSKLKYDNQKISKSIARNVEMKNYDGVVVGSMEVNDENIQGHVYIPRVENIKRHKENQSTYNNLNNRDAITKHVQGHIDLPSREYIQENKDYLSTDSNQNKGDVITGSIEINDENIQGHIDIPTDDEMQKRADGTDNDDNQNKSEATTESMEVNVEHVQEHVDIPSDTGNQINGKAINKTNDFIKVQVELSSEVEIAKHPKVEKKYEDGKKYLEDSTKINDGYIERHLIPAANFVNSDQQQYGVTGDREIKGDNIEGFVDISSDQNSHGHKENTSADKSQNNGNVIADSMEINDQNIQGHIDIPGDFENEKSGDLIKTDKSVGKYKNCWMSLNCHEHYKALDELDGAYSKARQTYQNDVGDDFSAKMLDALLVAQGAAPRAIHQAGGDPKKIPSGINLGGYCMMRMQGSLLFFHRMKLRNNTQFTVNYLQTNLADMTLTVRLSLNDIHLQGAYERCITDVDPSIMYYAPNFGEIEVLLKSVNYKMEGRLRLLNNRLIIEVVKSDILCNKILMTYLNTTFQESPVELQPRNIEAFLDRMKADLDLWLKDYFNDYLMYFGIVDGGNSQLLEYEKKKTIRLNEYADDAISSIKARLRKMKMVKVKLPHFTIKSLANTKIALTNGKLTGLDSIYRRSVATTKKENKIRKIGVMIGFSSLKVEYSYEAQISAGMPPLTGKLILTADELAAHLEITHVVRPEAVDLSIESIAQIKPESLTVEGPANRLIANFKALLEHPILALMTNTLRHNIMMLKTLTRCKPINVIGNDDRIQRLKESKEFRDDTDSGVINNKINKGTDYDSFSSNKNRGGYSDISPNEKTPDANIFPGESDGNKRWADYVMTKNDSIELEVPIDGRVQTMKLKRTKKFVLSKVDKKLNGSS